MLRIVPLANSGWGDFMAPLSIFEATTAFHELAGNYSGTLDQYRGLLDASGLRLGHWPKVRLLSRTENDVECATGYPQIKSRPTSV